VTRHDQGHQTLVQQRDREPVHSESEVPSLLDANVIRRAVNRLSRSATERRHTPADLNPSISSSLLLCISRNLCRGLPNSL
jgi:hypothetical protein